METTCVAQTGAFSILEGWGARDGSHLNRHIARRLLREVRGTRVRTPVRPIARTCKRHAVG